jgi:hypothetical protein
VFVGGWGGASAVYLNNGTALRSAVMFNPATMTTFVAAAALFDFNLDGRPDLVVCSAPSADFGGCQFYKNNPSGACGVGALRRRTAADGSALRVHGVRARAHPCMCVYARVWQRPGCETGCSWKAHD